MAPVVGIDVILLCEVCRERVTNDGFITIDLRKAMNQLHADEERRLKGATGIDFRQVLDSEIGRVPWSIHHEACDPNPEREDYAIPSKECQTYAELTNWTAHLLEKNWIQHTSWGQTLRGIVKSTQQHGSS